MGRFRSLVAITVLASVAVPVTGVMGTGCVASTDETVIGGVDLGGLTNYLFVFTDGSEDANWQAATKGFAGDVAVDGVSADERTSGHMAFAGSIFSNDTDLGDWADIVDDNPGQAAACTGHKGLIAGLEADLDGAMAQIAAMPATKGFEDMSSKDLDGLDMTDGHDQTFVINITSDLKVSSHIDIAGDAGDVFVMRWDKDADPSDGYEGEVKFQSGGAIVPGGDLTPSNFIHVAGNINASGGGDAPAAPYPQGARFADGSLIDGGADFKGGGFFTGYWLTTGDPKDGETSSLSNAVFVGGWYTSTTKFSMTSGTSGVHVAPAAVTTAVDDGQIGDF